MVGAGVDWSRFRRAIPDSVHGFGRYRAWWSGVRFLWCWLIVGIPRFCGVTGVAGVFMVGTGADWIRFRSVFSDSVQAARPLVRSLARLPSHPRARRVNTNDCEVTPAKRYCNR
ncbi:hypothetical protein BPORC_1889 [Bifidobacterium porcinum]|nr:hypothetical protein BPORC_1889 [Bifidobacterium porcinum]